MEAQTIYADIELATTIVLVIFSPQIIGIGSIFTLHEI